MATLETLALMIIWFSPFLLLSFFASKINNHDASFLLAKININFISIIAARDISLLLFASKQTSLFKNLEPFLLLVFLLILVNLPQFNNLRKSSLEINWFKVSAAAIILIFAVFAAITLIQQISKLAKLAPKLTDDKQQKLAGNSASDKINAEKMKFKKLLSKINFDIPGYIASPAQRIDSQTIMAWYRLEKTMNNSSQLKEVLIFVTRKPKIFDFPSWLDEKKKQFPILGENIALESVSAYRGFRYKNANEENKELVYQSCLIIFKYGNYLFQIYALPEEGSKPTIEALFEPAKYIATATIKKQLETKN
jgi:hypothetical protein